MRARVGVWCVLLSICSACGGKQSPATDPPQSPVDAAVAMLVEMGQVVMAAGADCDRMATDVDAWIDANGERRKKVNAELVRVKSPETEDAYREGLSEHLDVVQAMRVGIDGCQANEGFKRAWSRLDE